MRQRVSIVFLTIPLVFFGSAAYAGGYDDSDDPPIEVVEVVAPRVTQVSSTSLFLWGQEQLLSQEELKKQIEQKEEMAFDEDCEEEDNARAICEFLVEAGFAVTGVYVSGPLFVAYRAAVAANATLKGSKLAKVVVKVDNKVQLYLENVPASVRAFGAVVGVALERVLSLPDWLCSQLLGDD